MGNQARELMFIELAKMEKLIYLHDTTSTNDNGSRGVKATGGNDSSQQLLVVTKTAELIAKYITLSKHGQH